MPRKTTDLSDTEREFLTERHLGTLTTVRENGTPHVVAIAFGFDAEAGVVRIISSDRTQKVNNVDRTARAVVCQVDGRRWLSLEGAARVERDPDGVAMAVAAFEARYRPARENPNRVAIEIQVDRVLGRA
ncbi:MAG: TIGR03618 family F420-dependent PPOX class oxidoreductase [Actinobacteria bacterium]|nr:MAG: TIGR03618 family F420-dependent PPOX class oxidoreductase [Actinomycetota bacterium]